MAKDFSGGAVWYRMLACTTNNSPTKHLSASPSVPDWILHECENLWECQAAQCSNNDENQARDTCLPPSNISRFSNIFNIHSLRLAASTFEHKSHQLIAKRRKKSRIRKKQVRQRQKNLVISTRRNGVHEVINIEAYICKRCIRLHRCYLFKLTSCLWLVPSLFGTRNNPNF